jgi:hypothetical protein
VVVVALTLVVGAAVSTGADVATARPASAAPATKAATKAQQHSVLRLYKAYFLRDPSQREIDYWADRYASGRASLASISSFFAQSNEFKNRYGSLTDAQFVDLVYRNVLGRTPDAAGVKHWVGALGRGQSRGSVMIGFSESGEFQRRTNTVSPTGWTADQLAGLAVANKSRSGQRLRTLTAHNVAKDKAQRWAAHLASIGRLEHSGGGTSVDTSGLSGWCSVGENVGWGSSIESIQAAFMNSATHRNNLLGNWTHMGVGVAKRGNSYYITQLFIRAC